MIRVGVLALQGSVIEHIKMLEKIFGVIPIEVRSKEDILNIDALIIPGGESTTIGKLLNDFDLMDSIKERIMQNMPVWGTCAGMILLAKELENEDIPRLKVMDIVVRRNAYGSQLDSFTSFVKIDEISNKELKLIFIRAPWVCSVGDSVKVLLELDNKIVAVRQGKMLATSFHPELTDDISFHKYFVDIVNGAV